MNQYDDQNITLPKRGTNFIKSPDPNQNNHDRDKNQRDPVNSLTDQDSYFKEQEKKETIKPRYYDPDYEREHNQIPKADYQQYEMNPQLQQQQYQDQLPFQPINLPVIHPLQQFQIIPQHSRVLHQPMILQPLAYNNIMIGPPSHPQSLIQSTTNLATETYTSYEAVEVQYTEYQTIKRKVQVPVSEEIIEYVPVLMNNQQQPPAYQNHIINQQIPMRFSPQRPLFQQNNPVIGQISHPLQIIPIQVKNQQQPNFINNQNQIQGPNLRRQSYLGSFSGFDR